MKRSHLPLNVTLFVLVFFYLPILVLVVNSFNAARFGSGWEGFTLMWYQKLLHQPNVWHALSNTLIIAVGATLLSMVLGTMSAFGLHRYTDALQKYHFFLIYTPLVIPEILMGMSLLLFFIALGMQLGLFTIFLAHVTFCISYVAMVVLGRLQDFDFSLVEAAQDLGATWWTTLWRVLLPLLMPGIISGGLLAFTLSIDDYVITFFVAGPGSSTLPLYIYSMIKHSKDMPIINALSTILLALTAITVFISQHLTQEKRS
jgi:spermidine/putrescine transport system permease protein